MARESNYTPTTLPVPKVIFSENFNDEFSTRKNGGVPTDVTYAKGVGEFVATNDSKVIYSKTYFNGGIGTNSFRFKIKSTDIDAASTNYMFTYDKDVSFRLAYGSNGSFNVTGLSSIKYYKNGIEVSNVPGLVEEGVEAEYVITGTVNEGVYFNKMGEAFNGTSNASFNCNILEIYEGTLSAENVANLYKNAFYAGNPIIQDTLQASKVFAEVEGTGVYEEKQLTFYDAGGERASNGNFDSSDDWILGGTASISNGTLNLLANMDDCRQEQSVTDIVEGQVYEITIVVDSIVDNYVRADVQGTLGTIRTTAGTYTERLIAGSETTRSIRIYTTSNGAVVSSVSVKEVLPLPNMDSGYNYLECTTAGTKPYGGQKEAYGTWEFDLYKGTGASSFAFIGETSDAVTNGYTIKFPAANQFILRRVDATNIMSTVSSYIENNTWYRIKVTRTSDGEFTVSIKGGDFGDEYVLVDTTSGSGTNPVTDNTYTTSDFFLVDLDQDDRIGNITITSEVKE